MAYEIPGRVITREAAGDLSGSLFKFVKQAGATVTAVAAATDVALGVLQNKPDAAGKASAVMIDGISRVVAAEALSAGVDVYLSADGSVTATVQVGNSVGTTQDSCSGAGKLVSVLLKPLGSVGA